MNRVELPVREGTPRLVQLYLASLDSFLNSTDLHNASRISMDPNTSRQEPETLNSSVGGRSWLTMALLKRPNQILSKFERLHQAPHN
jgi:hypothetical protein